MAGLIDLNTAEDDETPSSGGSSSTSATSMSITTATPSASSVCLELWHACAGPMICLPKKGSVVVYFPQGHLELVQDLQLLLPNIPPHVFCRVVDVKLHVSVPMLSVTGRVRFLFFFSKLVSFWVFTCGFYLLAEENFGKIGCVSFKLNK